MVRITANIDLAAIRNNLAVVRRFAPDAKISAVVKANAYGHGVDRVVTAIYEHIDACSVATIDEGVRLRTTGLDCPIWVFSGYINAEELDLIKRYELTPVIHNEHQLNLLRDLNKKISVIIEVDTGMGRLGIHSHELDSFLKKAAVVADIKLIQSHFSESDIPNSQRTLAQIDRFENLPLPKEYQKSLANSAGIIARNGGAYDWVRPGLIMYGVSPFSSVTGPELGLQPSMSLQSRLISIRRMKKGNTIGYHGTWECPEDMPVGFVSCGYADGYPRNFIAETPVIVRNQKASIIGRISMDSFAIDLRGIPTCKIGDSVLLWGPSLPIELIAEKAGTIPNQLLTGLTDRVAKTFVS